MKNIFVFVILFPTLALGQASRIDLDKLPPLNQSWGSVEYKKILTTFYEALNNQVPLPQMNDPYYKDFYSNLLNKENLSIFTDTTFSADGRFQMASPFFEILPAMLVVLTEGDRYNEAVAIDEFLMEAMLQSTYLMNDLMREMPSEEHRQFIVSVKTGKGIYQSAYGALHILALEKGEDGVDFTNLLSLANWCNQNIPSLWEWMDDLDQQDCLAQIRSLINTQKTPEIKTLMKALLQKLEK